MTEVEAKAIVDEFYTDGCHTFYFSLSGVLCVEVIEGVSYKNYEVLKLAERIVAFQKMMEFAQ